MPAGFWVVVYRQKFAHPAKLSGTSPTPALAFSRHSAGTCFRHFARAASYASLHAMLLKYHSERRIFASIGP